MAQYYLNTASTGSGDGTTTAITGANAAWKDISEITGLAAGDTVSFNKGNAWRETLTVPSSGSSGSPITFGAYGSGADPIINANNVVSTFSQYLKEENETFTTFDVDYSIVKTDIWHRTIIPANQLDNNGTQIRVQLRAHSTSDTTIMGCSVGENSGVDFSESPIRITFDSGGNGCTIVGGATKWSDWVNYTWTKTNEHLIHTNIEDTGGTCYVRRKANYLSGTYYNHLEDGDKTMVQDVTETGQSSEFYNVQQIEIKYVATGVYYKLDISPTFGGEVGVVLVDDSTLLTYNNDEDTLAQGEYAYESGVDDLYIRLSGDANPSGSTIEVHWRDTSIKLVGKDYVIIDGLHLKGGTHGYWLYQNCDYNIIKNCTVNYTASKAIKLEGEGGIVTNNMVQDNDMRYVGGAGRTGDYSPFAIQIDATSGTPSTGNIIESNLIRDTEYGYFYISNSDSNIIRFNKCLDSSASVGAFFTGSDSNEVYYNIIEHGSNDSDRIIRLNTGSLDNEIYNNTLKALNDTGIELSGNSTGTKIKNNIIDNTTTVIEVDAGSDTGVDIDNNCYKNTTGTPFDWVGTDYNFADWKTNSSQDANSTNSNPLMTDPANDDFTLQLTSPCINTGTDVGLTQDYAGNSVLGIPDIGAYEHQGVEAAPSQGSGLHMGMGMGMT